MIYIHLKCLLTAYTCNSRQYNVRFEVWYTKGSEKTHVTKYKFSS